MNTMQHQARRFGRCQQGQGMTEYIIIVALIAIAAIAVFTFFGGTLRSQASGMAQELAGEDASGSIGKAKETAAKAKDEEGDKNKGLKNYDNDAARGD